MDEKTSESGKVEAVLHAVAFYSQSSHNASFRKAVPSVHKTASTCTASDLGSCDVSVNCRPVQKTVNRLGRYSGSRKSTVLDKRPKSVESVRCTKSKYRLIRKPKHTLLPYMRGQLKFCTESGNVIVRNGTSVELSSEPTAEKEKKLYSDDQNVNANTEKLNMRRDSSRRFFKASFGKRRQFTLGVRGLTTSHIKLNNLKQRERNTDLRVQQVCLNATTDCCKSKNDVESVAECCKNNLSVVSKNTTFETSCKDAACKHTEVAVESSDRSVENDTRSDNANTVDCMVRNNLCSSSDVEECCPIASTSNVMDHSVASPVTSASDSESYSDNTVTSPSQKRNTFFYLLLIELYMHQHLLWILFKHAVFFVFMQSGCPCVLCSLILYLFFNTHLFYVLALRSWHEGNTSCLFCLRVC